MGRRTVVDFPEKHASPSAAGIFQAQGPRHWRDASGTLGKFIVAVFLLLLLPSPAPAADAENVKQDDAQRVGRLLKLRLPITAESDRLVKRFVSQTMDEAEKKRFRPVLIFEFEVPPGQEDFGRGSQFEASLALARFLSSDELAGATTVAYIPHSIQGHALLPVIACDEIIMAPGATIGQAGIDTQPIEDDMRGAYRVIAQRRRTVPVELALGMLDPAREVLDVETEVSREFVTPEGLEELKKQHTIAGKKVLIPAGEPGQFTGEAARGLGFASYLAEGRRELERALSFPPGSIEDNILLADKWETMRINLDDHVTASKIHQIQQQIQEHVDRGTNFVCLYINSPGGSPEDSAILANFLVQLPPSRVRTVAYIPYKALSDAAMVALACDQVVMRPDAILGGDGASVLTSRQEVEDIVSGIQARAREKSQPWSLPAAMIDDQLEVFRCTRLGITEYFCQEELDQQPDKDEWAQGARVTSRGQQFGAKGEEAVDYHLANCTVENFDQFKEHFGLEDDPTLVEPNWAHSFVTLLASPGAAALLLMIGGVAVYAEMHTPGIGLGAFLALVCFVLFFWAQYIGENAAWLEILLFLVGIVCLLVEVFVLPGFGVFGIGGGALVLVSLVLATQTFILPHNAYQLHQFSVSLGIVAAAGLGTVGMAAMLNRWLPHAPVLNRVLLTPPSDHEKEMISQNESLVHFEELLGRSGVTTTQLTPGGKARFGNQIIDVMADGDLIEPGTRVTVVEIHGNRVTVEAVEKEN